MLEIIQREAVYLWYYFSVQFEQIFKYWILGMLIGSAVSVFLKDRIHGVFRSLGDQKLGIFGIPIASALGIASPLCMYGTIPIAASFSKSGIKDDWLAAFMMSSVLLNPQLILYSMALGTTALMVRILFCFLCGIAAGLLVHCLCHNQSFFRFDRFDEANREDCSKIPKARKAHKFSTFGRSLSIRTFAGHRHEPPYLLLYLKMKIIHEIGQAAFSYN